MALVIPELNVCHPIKWTGACNPYPLEVLKCENAKPPSITCKISHGPLFYSSALSVKWLTVLFHSLYLMLNLLQFYGLNHTWI